MNEHDMELLKVAASECPLLEDELYEMGEIIEHEAMRNLDGVTEIARRLSTGSIFVNNFLISQETLAPKEIIDLAIDTKCCLDLIYKRLIHLSRKTGRYAEEVQNER